MSHVVLLGLGLGVLKASGDQQEEVWRCPKKETKLEIYVPMVWYVGMRKGPIHKSSVKKSGLGPETWSKPVQPKTVLD